MWEYKLLFNSGNKIKNNLLNKKVKKKLINTKNK